jgi:hypothetical protein
VHPLSLPRIPQATTGHGHGRCECRSASARCAEAGGSRSRKFPKPPRFETRNAKRKRPATPPRRTPLPLRWPLAFSQSCAHAQYKRHQASRALAKGGGEGGARHLCSVGAFIVFVWNWNCELPPERESGVIGLIGNELGGASNHKSGNLAPYALVFATTTAVTATIPQHRPAASRPTAHWDTRRPAGGTPGVNKTRSAAIKNQ